MTWKTLTLAALVTVPFAAFADAEASESKTVSAEAKAASAALAAEIDHELAYAVVGQRRPDRFPNRYGHALWGATGLIFVPTSSVSPQNSVTMGMAITEDFSAASANWGLTNDIEVGLSYLDRSGSDNKLLANGKIRIIPANFDTFEIAVGILDAADAIDQTIYVVGSANLIVPDAAAAEGAVGLRVHAGVGTGYFSEKLFAGGELIFADRFTIIGEWDTKDFNAGVRYRHNDEFSATAGAYSSRLFIGMNYTLRF